ncbi:DUF5641 domain-containing protein [Aphis craccivora]|uniref:DUF5641 domain-containing protein n=1 Tax=Aphis craccivora TaxID=307492 RepID=A0A6G0YGG6_APHCR|nr:DUF5641 domain-containing protein [Aphis craccivora]
MTCLVQNVIGDSKPNRSKTLTISEITDRFVGSICEDFVLNENTSALGSHFRPRILISTSSFSSYRRAGDIA